MTTPTRRPGVTAERDALKWFFGHVGASLGLVRKGKLVEGAESHPLYQGALETLRSRLASGWSLTDVTAAFTRAQMNGVRTVRLVEVLSTSYPPDSLEQNLLSADEGYYHHELWNYESPRIRSDGTTASAGSISRKAAYTLGDLADYYLDRIGSDVITRRTLGAGLARMLEQGTSLDALLTAIDICADDPGRPGPGASFYALRNYVPRAAEELRRKGPSHAGLPDGSFGRAAARHGAGVGDPLPGG